MGYFVPEKGQPLIQMLIYHVVVCSKDTSFEYQTAIAGKGESLGEGSMDRSQRSSLYYTHGHLWIIHPTSFQTCILALETDLESLVQLQEPRALGLPIPSTLVPPLAECVLNQSFSPLSIPRWWILLDSSPTQLRPSLCSGWHSGHTHSLKLSQPYLGRDPRTPPAHSF